MNSTYRTITAISITTITQIRFQDTGAIQICMYVGPTYVCYQMENISLQNVIKMHGQRVLGSLDL